MLLPSVVPLELKKLALVALATHGLVIALESAPKNNWNFGAGGRAGSSGIIILGLIGLNFINSGNVGAFISFKGILISFFSTILGVTPAFLSTATIVSCVIFKFASPYPDEIPFLAVVEAAFGLLVRGIFK